MKTPSLFPILFQFNTRVYLTSLSSELGKRATLDDIPDTLLDGFVQSGFQWIWLLSVWQTGKAGQKVSRKNENWHKEFVDTLPDLKEDDIPGSGFAITGYTVHEDLGGHSALARLRARMQAKGLNLMLDFVPNHVALDHPWVESNPDYFIQGTNELLATQPANYIKVSNSKGELILAYGRDPYFPGWPDTLQLDYSNPALQRAMLNELIAISEQCDGVRCDMAMLIEPGVFQRTWGKPGEPFWPPAITKVHSRYPDFVFLAEVYWDMEWTLQQQGFSFTYDKRLYDRLKAGHVKPVREHFLASWNYQSKSARFLENHDEARAAKEFPDDKHKAAAVITYFAPGMRFFHQGQLEGKQKRISPHLNRGPVEPINTGLQTFYHQLLQVIKLPLFHAGTWKLLNVSRAGAGNSYENYIGFAWAGVENEKAIIVVNYSPHRSQGHLEIPFPGLGHEDWILTDQLSETRYTRNGTELTTKGLYLDEPGWRYYCFLLRRV